MAAQSVSRYRRRCSRWITIGMPPTRTHNIHGLTNPNAKIGKAAAMAPLYRSARNSRRIRQRQETRNKRQEPEKSSDSASIANSFWLLTLVS